MHRSNLHLIGKQIFFFFYHCGYKGKIILVNCVASDSAGGNALRIVGSTDMEQPWPRIALRR